MVDTAHCQKQGGLVKGVDQQECGCGGQGSGVVAAKKHDQNAQRHDGGVGQHALEIRGAQGLNGAPYGLFDSQQM